jgi:hypothetical protein
MTTHAMRPNRRSRPVLMVNSTAAALAGHLLPTVVMPYAAAGTSNWLAGEFFFHLNRVGEFPLRRGAPGPSGSAFDTGSGLRPASGGRFRAGVFWSVSQFAGASPGPVLPGGGSAGLIRQRLPMPRAAPAAWTGERYGAGFDPVPGLPTETIPILGRPNAGGPGSWWTRQHLLDRANANWSQFRWGKAGRSGCRHGDLAGAGTEWACDTPAGGLAGGGFPVVAVAPAGAIGLVTSTGPAAAGLRPFLVGRCLGGARMARQAVLPRRQLCVRSVPGRGG